MDQSSPMITGETPQRPKLTAQRKEQILSPISNGLTPVRVRILFNRKSDISKREKADPPGSAFSLPWTSLYISI